MKALLIDPKTQTITPLEINDWRDIAPALECDLFDVVSVDPNVSIYVDDEGLYVQDQGFFYMPSAYPHPLAGKALVLGTTSDGDSTDCPVTLEWLEARVFWLGHATLTA